MRRLFHLHLLLRLNRLNRHLHNYRQLLLYLDLKCLLHRLLIVLVLLDLHPLHRRHRLNQRRLR